MLACASELSAEFKEELRGVRTALQQQGACNVAVDSVVSEEVIHSRCEKFKYPLSICSAQCSSEVDIADNPGISGPTVL